MFSLENITNSIQNWLIANFSPGWVLVIQCLMVMVFAITLFAVLGLVLVLMERKSRRNQQPPDKEGSPTDRQ